MKRLADPLLCFLCFLVAALGVFFVWDAGYPIGMRTGSGLRGGLMQLVWFGVAIGAFFLARRIEFEKWKRSSTIIFLLALIGCGLVFAPVIGVELNNAHRWFGYGPIRIQPSEFLKLASIVFLAALLEKMPRRQRYPKPVHWTERAWSAMPFALVVVGALAVELEPDLGTAGMVLGIFLGMLILGGVRGKVIFSLAAAGVVLAFALIQLQPYRLARIMAHEDRWSAQNAKEIGFQSVRSELGIGMGGAMGQGIGMGITKYSLPVATTDFIFTTIAEEAGFVGAMFMLILIGGIVWRLFALSGRAPNRYASLVIAGIGWWIGLQSGVNILMVTGVLPPIGIPLPLLSAGGSSLVALGIAFGIVQSAMASEQEERLETDRVRWGDRRTRVPRASSRMRRGLTRV